MTQNIRKFLLDAAQNEELAISDRIAAAQAVTIDNLSLSVERIISLDMERSVERIAVEMGDIAAAVRSS